MCWNWFGSILLWSWEMLFFLFYNVFIRFWDQGYSGLSRWVVLLFCFFMTHYHKFRGLKWLKFIIFLVFMAQKSAHNPGRFSASVFCKARIKVLVGLSSFLQGLGEESTSQLIQAMGLCRIEVSHSSLLCQFQVLKITPHLIPSHRDPVIFK